MYGLASFPFVWSKPESRDTTQLRFLKVQTLGSSQVLIQVRIPWLFPLSDANTAQPGVSEPKTLGAL